VRRVNVRGPTGSGKTTTSRRLAAALGVPHIELDALHWEPNWSEPPAEEFRARVGTALDAAANGWVVDGSYDGKLRGLVLERADTLVFLDLPLRVCLTRIWRRTWRRLVHREQLWNENRETFRNAFLSRNSLFLWLLKTHTRYARTLAARAANYPHLRLVHLRSPAEVERFLADVS
jgi:adenylate kinase family enzyme